MVSFKSIANPIFVIHRKGLLATTQPLKAIGLDTEYPSCIWEKNNKDMINLVITRQEGSSSK